GRFHPAGVAVALLQGQGRRVAGGIRRPGPPARLREFVAARRHQLELLLEQRRRAEGCVKAAIRRARRKVGAIRRRLFESPEQAAWRRAWHQAETTPRFTPGVIRMMEYNLRYSDLLSFCPQWQDIFVKRALAFTSAGRSPRILDCGANVGLASLFFHRLYPAARITAFEADPALFQMLD